ncbi:MAG: hypothetical protein Q8N37_02650 [bacterium]|nr:hypothetical protein [bacterium]
MSFKKSVYIAAVPRQLKRVKEMEFGDINVLFVTKIFKANEENPDCRISFGKNMFAENKP